MNREQVYCVLKLLNDAYPNFQVNQSKIDNWTRLLKGQNPAIIMRNAERYVIENKFPPSLADLREAKWPFMSTAFIKLRKDWERDAIGHKPGG